ncbi:MAG: amino acid-binding protein [Bacteroidaceae bacterium]|nr:amino acid-binding protein [Bacteroidaceae bacterium]
MIHQLSVFIENKSGTLLQILELLKNAGIQLVATNIVDTMDYGICRIIATQPQLACTILQEAGMSANLNEVFAIQLDNHPGSAADAIAAFAQEGVGIVYLYSFLLGGKGVLIFRTDNTERAQVIIKESGLQVINENDLQALT